MDGKGKEQKKNGKENSIGVIDETFNNATVIVIRKLSGRRKKVNL